jgi:hypothetical protein
MASTEKDFIRLFLDGCTDEEIAQQLKVGRTRIMRVTYEYVNTSRIPLPWQPGRPRKATYVITDYIDIRTVQ